LGSEVRGAVKETREEKRRREKVKEKRGSAA